uniref:2,3-bisphosphoglycerate-independent phosphoglycerate mutase n=1 Tax=Meloidogyne hapla TaxID=6305 RepID=A0A1I8BZQ1_MELHA
MSNNESIKQKVCLVVIDGWGLSDEEHGNAIAKARTPVMDKLCSGNWQKLEAHGLHVGLPEGLMGNSEVGHLNIGAGRVIYQDIVRINLAVKRNEFVKNSQIIASAERAKSGSGRLHLLGLVSDGGVHSHIDHLFALIRAFKDLHVPKLFIHFFADGRDTSPTSGAGYLEQLLKFISSENYGELATIVGRYYAMDRDKRWERIKMAYEAIIGDIGHKSTIDKAVGVVKERYAQSETDEFLKPIVFSDDGRVKDNDTLIFFNYRADRMRQICECLGMERYKGLQSSTPHPKNLEVSGMTQYNKEFPFPSLFPPTTHTNVLAEWLASQGVSQFHCAETEKYAHVTFFFNGGREVQFQDEERCMVPSPKVATYDLQPEMNASGVAEKMIEQIKLGKHPFIMCNFAPPDMVGHTGQFEPAVKACEATDEAIGRIYDACQSHNYILMVTADHGNSEKMIASDGGKHTAHTCNLVPFTCSSSTFIFKLTPPFGDDGKERARALRDVAPTVLQLMGLSCRRRWMVYLYLKIETRK